MLCGAMFQSICLTAGNQVVIYFFLLYRYDMGKSLLDSVFGSKFHPAFPRKIRLDTDGCRGKGFYPSKLYSGDGEYWSQGVDLEISEGEAVCSSLLIIWMFVMQAFLAILFAANNSLWPVARTFF